MFEKPVRCEKFIQFGEGGFLRGFADWIIQLTNEATDFNASVVVVQPIEKGMCEMLEKQNCVYTHIMRGMKDGVPTVEKKVVDVISRTVEPYRDFEAYLNLAANPDFRFVISNTTESGICFNENDRAENAPNVTFPAKVTLLLKRRFDLGLKGFIFLPCELIDKNGSTLRQYILDYAKLWGLGDDFAAWVQNENIFCNTLVDRIVTARKNGRPVIWSQGAHVIKNSLSRYIIELMKMGRDGKLSKKFPEGENRLINGHEGVVWVPSENRFAIVLIRGGDSYDPTRYREDETYFEYGCDGADGLFCDKNYFNPDMLLHLPERYKGLRKLPLSVAKRLSFADPYACAIFQLERMEDLGEAHNFRIEMAKHKCSESEARAIAKDAVFEKTVIFGLGMTGLFIADCIRRNHPDAKILFIGRSDEDCKKVVFSKEIASADYLCTAGLDEKETAEKIISSSMLFIISRAFLLIQCPPFQAFFENRSASGKERI